MSQILNHNPIANRRLVIKVKYHPHALSNRRIGEQADYRFNNDAKRLR